MYLVPSMENRRGALRAPITMAVRLHTRDNGLWLCQAINISLGGMYLTRAAQPVSLASGRLGSCKLDFTLPRLSTDLCIDAELVREWYEDKRHYFAVLFSEIESESYRSIDQYVQSFSLSDVEELPTADGLRPISL